MALTTAQRKSLLIARVGETSGGLLAANIDALWDLYAAEAAVSAALRDLYVRRDLIEIALADARTKVTFTDGDYSQSASHLAQRLEAMLAAAQAELERFEAAQQGAGGAAVGELATVTPDTPPSAAPSRPYGPDAFDPEYVGDPYWPRARRAGRRW